MRRSPLPRIADPFLLPTLAFVLLVTIYRFVSVFTSPYPLATEEMQYWDWSRSLDWSYYSKPPMVAWAIHVFTSILGDTAGGVRSTAAGFATLTLLVSWVFVRALYGPGRTVFVTLVIMSLVPLFAVGATVITTDTPLMFFWALACLSIYIAIRDNRRRMWYIAGLSLGLGILSKYAMVYLLPCLAVFFAIAPEHRHWLRRREPWLALLIGALFFLPVLYWNYKWDWITFRHVAGNAKLGDGFRFRVDTLGDYLGTQIALVTPFLFLPMLWYSGKILYREGRSAPLEDRYLIALGAPVFLMLLAKSVQGRVYGNWAALAYFTWTIFAIHHLEMWYERARASPRAKLARVYTAGALGLMLFAFVLLHERWMFEGLRAGIQSVGIRLSPKADPGYQLFGYDDMGRWVTQLRDEMPDPGRTFVLADRYHVAAAMSFYVEGQPRALLVNFGGRMNQYTLWGPPDESHTGWDAIFVDSSSRRPEDSLDVRIARNFDRVSEPLVLEIESNGEVIRYFTAFLCYGFHGEFPDHQDRTGVY